MLTFQRHLPLEEPPDLIHQWKYCYARSVGCVGILKDWLTKALDEALESNEKTLSLTLLERHAISADRCDQMISDIEEGEKRMAADPGADERLLFTTRILRFLSAMAWNDTSGDRSISSSS